MMGKNHASYFDQQGWLYFTKEYFDLFYPSYGDTYPIFNGSIGMTYEQAGHARAGLSILVNEEDTLTLVDRIRHHHTTALSTIQMASNNALALNQAFQSYFKDARTFGSGNYSGFLIRKKSSAHWEKLVTLLTYNKIEFQELESGTALSGYHYPSMGAQRMVTESGDLWISAKQSQGNLVRVLFEPHSVLADSATYDITSWALPFAYGLDAYAIEKAVGLKTRTTDKATLSSQAVTQPNEVYGLIGSIRSSQDAVMISKALQAGIRIRYSEKELVVSGKTFSRGSPIILSAENNNQKNKLSEFMNRYIAKWTVLPSGLVEGGVDMGSDKMHVLRNKHVALVVDETCSPTSVGDLWHYFDKELQYPLHLVSSKELQRAPLNQIDVLIFPDGQHKMLADKESALKQWVKEGGRIIAMEQSIESMITGEWGVKWKKSTDNAGNEKGLPERYEDRERNALSSNTPGAVYKLKLDHSHPLAFGYPPYYFTLKQNNQLLETNATSWNVGWIDDSGYVSGYVGSEARKQLKDGTLIAVQDIGRGQVVYFVDNPVFRGFWENGKRLLFNAVFYLGH
ncbi:MAG: zinc carboxypeptidase, partial [Ferruginibacter sp.]